MISNLSSTGSPLRGIAASTLMEMSFPEARWAIPGILPEGINILAGKPKKGKSIFALNICLDIAIGYKVLNRIHAEKGTVLYFALEDSERRLQDRIGLMMRGEQAPEQLILYNKIEGTEIERLAKLRNEIKNFPNTRLVVIDTLAMFLAGQRSNIQYSYEQDYQKIVQFKEIADKYHISMLLNHHQRKMAADDVMDTILGTQGIAAAADGLLVMVDGSGQSNCNLTVKGRDVEEVTFALKFDPEVLRWNLLESITETKSTPLKQKIYDLLKVCGEPLTPKIIAERTSLREQYVKNTLPKLLSEGGIIKVDRGQYVHIHHK